MNIRRLLLLNLGLCVLAGGQAHAQLTVSPSSLFLVAAAGGANPSAQTLAVSGVGGGTFGFDWTATVSTSNGGNWLSISPTSGNTVSSPNISVSASVAGLPPASYSGQITVTSPGLEPVVVPVALLAVGLTVSPSGFFLVAAAGGANPSAQTLAVSGVGGGTFGFDWTATVSTSSGGNWLSISPTAGNTTSSPNISVSANIAGLAPGNYSGQITVSASGVQPVVVPVALLAVGLTVSPSTLDFSASAGGANPSAQTLAVSGVGGGTFGFDWTATVSTSSGGNWLSISPTAGNTTSSPNISVSANIAGLAPASYSGQITVSASGVSPVVAPVTLTVSPADEPVPSLSSLSPSSATAGGPAFTLTVDGGGFVSGSVVRWNGSDRMTKLVSSLQLEAQILAADIASAGTAQVTVFNPAPGGGTSNAATFTISPAANPAPSIASISPTNTTAGEAGFTLTVNGGGFVSGSVVRWNGSDRTTTFVNSTQLQAAVASGDIAVEGTAQVTVFNTSPGGGTSNTVTFAINPADNPVPSLSSLSPGSATAGDASFTLTVGGSGFVSGSVVRWNGSDRTTSFVSNTQVRAVIPGSDVASSGTALVTVFNPAPGGGLSSSLTFTINSPANPVPSLSFLSPGSAEAGGGAFTLDVLGANFVSGAVVRWNGSDRGTTFLSSTQLRASVSAGDIASTGTAQVTVFNPAPGGGGSNALTFTITSPATPNPAPSLTSIAPNTVNAGGAAFTLVVQGAGFVSGSVVRWNGSDRPTTFVNSTQLQAFIAAALIAAPGTAQVTVFNPAPGGGASTSLALTISSANPVPTLTSLAPNSARAGGDDFFLTVNGQGFVSTSLVRWNGNNRPTLPVSSAQLQASISRSDIAAAGTAQVTVFNPAPGGGTSNALPFAITAPVPTLDVAPEFLNFEVLEGAPDPSSQSVQIRNAAGSNVPWTAEAKTTSGGDWLRISPASGGTPAFLLVRVQSSFLRAGIYSGLISVRDSSGITRSIVATLLVSRPVPSIRLSQAGFIFQGVEGGAGIPGQGFQVLNVGQGVMSWRAGTTTADGGNWLSVTPASGLSQAGAGILTPSTAVTVDSAQLRTGIFVGLVNFDASEAPNSPQPGVVLVNILPPGSDPRGLVRPAGVIFTATAGGASPAAQPLTLVSSGGKNLTFSITTSGAAWLSVTPVSGSLPASGGVATLQVQANTSGLTAGIQIGSFTVTLGTGQTQQVPVALVLTTTSAAAASLVPSADSRFRPASHCTPSRLVLIETLLSGNFDLSTGWPVALLAQLVDDCGHAVSDGNVTASFSNGDPTLVLANLRDGRYTGTWVPVSQASVVTVAFRAQAPALPEVRVELQGALETAGGPLTFRNGALNAASFAKGTPLVPGSIFALFGRNLASAPASATATPLPQELDRVRVTMGGLPAHLYYADAGQVNAQVPVELQGGRTASLLVSVQGVAAPPDEVTLADVQPGIFTMNASGSGQGAIVNLAGQVVDAKHPAAPGDIVQVFCTGLGATSPPVPSGTAASASPLAWTIHAVTATVGGLEAPVHFAGLAPGYVGLYQVNVQAPAGLAPGIAVPLVLTQAGVSSNTVTLAVR